MRLFWRGQDAAFSCLANEPRGKRGTCEMQCGNQSSVTALVEEDGFARVVMLEKERGTCEAQCGNQGSAFVLAEDWMQHWRVWPTNSEASAGRMRCRVEIKAACLLW